jgi:hypothetical protein
MSKLRQNICIIGMLAVVLPWLSGCRKDIKPVGVDGLEPHVILVQAIDTWHVLVDFDSEVTASSAQNVENYTIVEAESPVELEVIEAVLDTTTWDVTLTTEPHESMVYELTVQNVVNSAGLAVPVTIIQFQGIPADFPVPTLVELFTATWCHSCPEATHALDSLWGEFGPDGMVILQYHPSTGDPMGTPENDIRAVQYSVTEWPSAVFEGDTLLSSANAAYQRYRLELENRIGRRSPVKLGMDVTPSETEWHGVLEMVTAAHAPWDTMAVTVLIAVYEDSILYVAPNGETLHRFVVRDLVPDVEGMDFTLTEGMQEQIEFDFTADPGWITDRMGIVAIVYDPRNYHVEQVYHWIAGTP